MSFIVGNIDSDNFGVFHNSTQIDNCEIMVNGGKRLLDTPPILQDNRTMVPLRFLVNEMGGSVEWESTEQKVTISFENKVFYLWIGKLVVSVNGEIKQLDVSPIMRNGRILVPLRFILENLGYEAKYTNSTIEIYSNSTGRETPLPTTKSSDNGTTDSAPEATPDPVKAGDRILLGQDLEAYQSNLYEEKTNILMGGKQHSNAIVFRDYKWNSTSYANFNLDQQYSTITGEFGHVDGTAEYDVTMNIYGDGKLIKSIDLKPNMFAEKITIDVQGIRLLKFEAPSVGEASAKYAFCNMVLKCL